MGPVNLIGLRCTVSVEVLFSDTFCQKYLVTEDQNGILIRTSTDAFVTVEKL